MMRTAASVAILAVLSLIPISQAWADMPIDRMKNLVVMLNTSDGAGGTSCSAGIVISQRPERTLILSARHIRVKVAEELRDRANAMSIAPYLARLKTTAEFGWLPGKTYPANVVANSEDAELDYLLLSVEGNLAPSLPEPALLRALGAPEDGNREPALVVEMGNPACRRWDHTVTPHPIVEMSPAVIKAETGIDEEGLSGGALFKADGTLLGMIQRTGSGFLYARPITLLAGELRRKSFQFDLTEAPRPVARGDFEKNDISVVPAQFRDIVTRARRMKELADAASTQAINIKSDVELVLAGASAKASHAGSDVLSINLGDGSRYIGQSFRNGELIGVEGVGSIETSTGPETGARLFCRFDRYLNCVGGIGYYVFGNASSFHKADWLAWAGGIKERQPDGPGQLINIKNPIVRVWQEFRRPDLKLAVSRNSDNSVYEGEIDGRYNGVGALWNAEGQLVRAGVWKDGELIPNK